MAVLTGCSSTSSTSGGCEPQAKDGAASKLVNVKGDASKAPTVTFPTPIKTDTTQRKILDPGTGPGLVKGQKVTVELSAYNGSTGKPIQQSKYDGSDAASFVLNENTIQGLVKGLICAKEGSRVAIVVAPKDGFGPQGGNAQIGIGKDDSMVFIVDVVKSYLARANGEPQSVASDLPAVVLGANGEPGITVPSADPPKKLEVGVLKKGDGATVKEGDKITVHYTGVVWKTKEVFDSSWKRNEPAEFVAADGSKTQGGVIPGFAKALIGKKVGSQIIAVIPPDQGYGDKAQGAIPANSTLIFVVDILGIG